MTIGPEYRLHCVVADYLNRCLKPPAWWTSLEHGVKLPPPTWRRLARIGVRGGVPDILLVHEGRAHWIELKAERGRLSDAQELTRDALLAAGARWAEVRSLDALRASLEAWDVPTREQRKEPLTNVKQRSAVLA